MRSWARQNNKRIEYKVGIRATSAFAEDMTTVFRRGIATWVHRDVRDEAARARHAMLLIHLMAAAGLAMVILPAVLLFHFTLQQLVPAVLVASAVPLLLAGFLARTGRFLLTAAMALGCAAVAIATLAFATGGLNSPFLFWAMVLPLEAVLLGRNRKAVSYGVLALVATFGLVALASTALPQPPSPLSGDHALGSAVSIAGLVLYGLVVAGGMLNGQLRSGRTTVSDDTGMSSILNHLPGLVTFHDGNSVVCAIHGSDAKRMLKYVGDFSGSGFADHIHVSDRIGFFQAIDELRTGEETRSLIVRMRSRAGTAGEDQFRHWSIQLVALRPGGGEFSGFVAQSRDITAEIELRRSYVRKVGEAEAANEAKSRFLAAVSHELRTPLNAILGFSDILKSGICGNALDEQQAEYVGLIRQSGQHLLSVINSMLDLSKIDAGRYELNLEPFDIREAIDTCEAMLSQQARDNKIVLTTRVAKGHGQLIACRRAVQQVLINLMANAIKFTDENGVVTVDAMDHEGFMRISISDTGIGMSSDDLQKIGAPFVQLQTGNSRRYEGTGLGLSLVKGLIDLHDGRFTIESSPGLGTTVIVDLPLEGPGEANRPAEPQKTADMAFPPRLAPTATRETEDDHGQAKTA